MRPEAPPAPSSPEKLQAGLLDLVQWLSPAFPLGAFAYSHGLEWAIDAGEVRDGETLRLWLEAALTSGAGRNDAILAFHALRGHPPPAELAEIAEAMAPARERLEEMRAQGAAFCRTVAALTGRDLAPAPLPVSLGVAARALGLDEATIVTQMLQAFCSNLVAAGVRFVPLGQTEGQRVLRALHPTILRVCAQARTAPLSALGGAFLRGDMAAMHHETQTTRIFRT
ncbi:urease accessory protein UreF [Rhodobacteraceae bacterium WD3A24]|nr:urease accessory protein UreF [Rhodobacteraceae bacterium WD3A24]